MVARPSCIPSTAGSAVLGLGERGVAEWMTKEAVLILAPPPTPCDLLWVAARADASCQVTAGLLGRASGAWQEPHTPRG